MNDIGIDINATAEELKKFIDVNKFNLIDFGIEDLQCYPPPDDSKDYPHFKKLSSLYAEMQPEIDKVIEAIPDEDLPTEADDEEEGGQKQRLANALREYAPELAQKVDSIEQSLEEIVASINADDAFWMKIREQVIPIYEKSPVYEEWKNRWRRIAEIVYDSCPLTAQTTVIWNNPETGERKRGDTISNNTQPAGFIVAID